MDFTKSENITIMKLDSVRLSVVIMKCWCMQNKKKWAAPFRPALQLSMLLKNFTELSSEIHHSSLLFDSWMKK